MSAERTMILQRWMAAPPALVWRCWTDPLLLPRWFGPEGFHCETEVMDLRPGGEWRFDMIGPDGTRWANLHKITEQVPIERLSYTLHEGKSGALHASVRVTLAPEGDGTRVRMEMVFADAAQYEAARAIGAEALGQTTLGKLAALAEGLGG